RFESAWRAAPGTRPDPIDFLPTGPGERPGALLALLRTDLALRREVGQPLSVEWYRSRYPALDDEAVVALIYEEYCLREEAGEPQTLARLQHTHIVPVHSYHTDPATGLHLLCMPYFGRLTLARALADPAAAAACSGAELVAALDRLQSQPAAERPRSAARAA